jgi:nucleoside phosphorylase
MSVVTAAERINKEHANRIRKALREKKLVIIAGAGLSLSAFEPPPERLFWKGLIKDGLQYMEDTGLIDPDDEELLFHRRVLDWKNVKMKTLLRTCNYLRDELDEHGKFPTWLDSAFSTLLPDVRHPEVFDPIGEFHRRGARLMTTNYDELLEHHCGLQRIRSFIPDDVRKYEQGTLDGVFHIHGSYQDPQEVVLDSVDYSKVKSSEPVQELLKALLRFNVILFIGCGSGLEDPNFDGLLKWVSERERNMPGHHYLLVRGGDNVKNGPLVALKYGRKYEDLTLYLKELLDDPADVTTRREETSMLSRHRRIQPEGYTIGWVCALPIELAAAIEMLDEKFPESPLEDTGTGVYVFGRIGNHNVVVGALPAGLYGTTSAATIVAQMLSRFAGLRFFLLVGIGSGVPGSPSNVRLGDVVISQPSGPHGGVVQYDVGKVTSNARVALVGHLNSPPVMLLQGLVQLQANLQIDGGVLSPHLSAFHILRKFQRPIKDNSDPVIHAGTIASGNRLVKDAATRDKISTQLGGVLCFEMEAAGLMNMVPCLVIRGICDYADEHKDNSWQGYATATAAACAKALLLRTPAVTS